MAASVTNGFGQKKVELKHIVLKDLSFNTHTIKAKRLQAVQTLRSKNLHVGKALLVNGRRSTFHGVIHIGGNGEQLKPKQSSKDPKKQQKLSAALVINKSKRKGIGVAFSNKGGFFDHNNGYVTYESLQQGTGMHVNTPLKVSGVLYADGSLKLGGKGILHHSAVTGRKVYTTLHTNRHTSYATGFAVSDTGGFFDFKDDYITYEPLKGKKGFKVNGEFTSGK